MRTVSDDMLLLCRSCAQEVYGAKAPTAEYAERVARQLVGIAAAESGFKHRRQIGFSWEKERGAWGLWQTEFGAVSDSLKLLQRRPDLERRAAFWLYGIEGADMTDWYGMLPLHLLRTVGGWVRAGCLFCRLDMFQDPKPVPADLMGQADWWKKNYNSTEGAGTVGGYVEAWSRLVEPYLGG